MKSLVLLLICLLGVSLAAEKNAGDRKSRQILHQLVSVIGEPHAHSLYLSEPHHVLSQPHVLPQPHVISHPHVLPHPIQYIQPQALSAYPHAFHPAPQLPVSYLHSTTYHSARPQFFGNYRHNPISYTPYENAHQYIPTYTHHSHGSGYSGPGFSRPSFQQQPTSRNGSQFASSPASGTQSADRSFQSLISPSQDSEEEQRFNSGSQMNQNFGESRSSQQTLQQQQTQADFTSYRPSPRLYGPSPAIIGQFPNGAQSSAVQQSGTSSSSRSSQQQQQQPQTIQEYFPNTPSSSGSSSQENQQQTDGQNTLIISQSRQLGSDGSYSYGFQSANGIRTSESGVMRPEGQFRYVEGSYSYTAPDGTPISAQYFADHTGFHVQGDHLPTPPPFPVAAGGYPSSQSQPLRDGQVSVESN